MTLEEFICQESDAPRWPMVGLSGLEPLTSRLSGERSNQLSYRPGFSARPLSAGVEE
jgi:hypothetical protein